jgi:hypothetical protein
MTRFSNKTVLFDTDTWIVLTRAPFAFGPFSNRRQAKLFAACRGGIALTWYEPEWIGEGLPPDFGAVWFNNNWEAPFVVGPFYDCDEVAKWSKGKGIAVELDEFPDDYGPGDGEPVVDVANDNDNAGGQNRAA